MKVLFLKDIKQKTINNKHLTSLAPPKSCFIVDGGGTIAYTGFQSTQITHYEQRIIGSSSMSSMATGLAETVGVFATKKFEKLFCPFLAVNLYQIKKKLIQEKNLI